MARMSSHNVSESCSNAGSKSSSGSNEDHISQSRKQNAGWRTNEKEEEAAEVESSEGGLRAWLRVLGAFLVLANTMGLQSSFGVFQAYYAEGPLKEYSSSIIAWIGTFQIFCTATGSLISGPLFDLGYGRFAILLGAFFAVFAYMMTSLSSSYYQIFLAQGVAGGLAGACVFAPCVALAAICFEKRRSLAVGLATSGFIFGAVIYPIVFRELQPAIGFAWATRVMAFMALGCFLLAYPLLYWKTPMSRGVRRRIFDIEAWKDPVYATFCWAVFFMYAGYWPPYFFIIIFAHEAIGTSMSLAVYIFAIANSANLVARFTATLLADKLGIIEVLTCSTFASAIIAFCWPAVRSTAGLIVWAVAFGYFSGIMSALFAAVVPRLSPTPSVVGTRLGMLSGLFGIGCLISPPIAAAIISAQGNRFKETGGYLGMQMWAASCLIVAALLFTYPLVTLRRKSRQPLKSTS